MLNGGFIGFGRMGITHFSILNSHPDVKIAAICDSSSTMLGIVKKYLGVATYTDYNKMMDELDLDFVVISTPTDSHSRIIDDALSHQLHIFAEKPFALNPEDGTRILEKLKAPTLVNQVGYVNRFNEVFMAVKEQLGTGLIGEIKHYSSEMYGATVLKDSKSSWRGKKKAGGGCMYEFASHCIDLAVYLFGKPDRVKGSILQSVYSSDVEDIVSTQFVYNKGFNGNIMVNWSDESYRKPTNVVKIFGTKGSIIADKHAYKVYLREPSKTAGFDKGWNTRYITDFAKSVRFYVRGNEFTRQLDYFIDQVRDGGAENISSFSDAFITDELIDAIQKDALRTTQEDDIKTDTPIVIGTPADKTTILAKIQGLFSRR